MSTENEKDLNTEENYIAGNPLDGPAGNTAARPVPAVGMPSATGGAPSPATRPDPAELAELEKAKPAEIPDPNFNKSTRDVYNDQAHAANQASSADRGEFGVQDALGATHGGHGNQFREGVTEHGGLDRKYYGEGVVRADSGDENAYRAYDGHDERPDVQASPVEQAAVLDTPPAAPVFARQPTDGRGNAVDNRNQPDTTGAAAAFLNDNGSVEMQGAGYAPDYGHTSGVGLPRAAGQSLQTPSAPGRNQREDQRSSRGGYDNQGSAGGAHRDAAGPASGGAAAPSGPAAPHAPQGEGYGYGHARSEQPKPGDSHTGAERQGSTPGTPLATHGGDAAQGYGSQGGSYDDKNPGARADADQQGGPPTPPATGADEHGPDYGSAPRRNAGRDDEQVAE